MIKISLNRNLITLVDDEDLKLVKRFKWSAGMRHGIYYATSEIKKGDGTRTTLLMHRLIMNAPAGKRIDHIDGNGLNNQKSNLRFATPAQRGKNDQ